MARNFIFNNLPSLRRLTKKEGIAAGITLCFLLLGLWLPQRLSLSVSPSLDHRLFFLLRLPGKDKIRTGDHIVFSHPDTEHIHQGLSDGKDLLIKKIGCSPGEILTAGGNGIYCQGTFLGKSLPNDGLGRQLPQFAYIGLIPANKYFMIGRHERSFDSRYFGFIDADDFRYKAVPLW